MYAISRSTLYLTLHLLINLYYLERSDCGEKFLLRYEDAKSRTFVNTLDTKVFDRIPIIPRSPVAVFFGLVGMERGYVCKG